MIDFIFIIVGVGIIFCLYVMFKPLTEEEKEYERKLKDSLKDEYLIDPETGDRITLEEAETGVWKVDYDEFKPFSQTELDKLASKEEKKVQIALNYLRTSRNYKRTELSDEQFDILNNSKILSNYDSWNYSNPFSFENGILILPVPISYNEQDYGESQVMFWKKINSINGHYVLREKVWVEKKILRPKNKNRFPLKEYVDFTFKQSSNLLSIKQILNQFIGINGLIIEINNDNLFVKTCKLVNLEEIIIIENALKKVR